MLRLGNRRLRAAQVDRAAGVVELDLGDRARGRETPGALEVDLRALELRPCLAQPLGRDDGPDAAQSLHPRPTLAAIDGAQPDSPSRWPTIHVRKARTAMSLLFAIFLVVHGVLHLMGAAKAFQVAEIPRRTQPISQPLGVLWLLAAGLLFTTAGALFTWP